MIVCPRCKNSLKDNAKFCDQCGMRINDGVASSGAHSAPHTNTFMAMLSGITSKISTKALKTVFSAIAIILVISIIFSVFNSASADYGFAYYKDNELYYTNSETKGKQVTSELLNGTTSIGSIEEYVRLSVDGKKLFFIDKYDGTGYDLYYKNTNKLKKESVKITANVNKYDINDNGTLITYIKDGGALYQHNLKEQSDKIDSSVMSFIASDDGKKIIYTKAKADADVYAVDLYLSRSGKAGEIVIEGINTFKYISEDLNTIYFIKNGAFYKAKIGKKPELIAEGVQDVFKVYESGEAYFTKYNSDNNITTLYYYPGKKEPVSISEEFMNYNDSANDIPLIVFSTKGAEGGVGYKAYVAVKDKITALEHEVASVDIDDSGKELYYITNLNTENNMGDLYSVKISGSKIGKSESVDSNVHAGYYIDKAKYLYVKDYMPVDKVGVVYLNNKKVSDKAYWEYINYSKEKETLIFFTDVTLENNATINVFKSNKATRVMENVYMYSLSIAPKGELLFIADYQNGEGALNICKNKTANRIDVNVSKIIRFATNEEHDSKMLLKF